MVAHGAGEVHKDKPWLQLVLVFKLSGIGLGFYNQSGNYSIKGFGPQSHAYTSTGVPEVGTMGLARVWLFLEAFTWLAIAGMAWFEVQIGDPSLAY